MAKLDDPAILAMIETAFRERTCVSYVHWEPEAEKEFEEGCPQLSTSAVNDRVALFFASGHAPDIEVQKADSGYEGELRYVWRIRISDVKLYLKAKVEMDHLKEPTVIFVRCHVDR